MQCRRLLDHLRAVAQTMHCNRLRDIICTTLPSFFLTRAHATDTHNTRTLPATIATHVVTKRARACVQTLSVNQSRVTNARARAYLPQLGLLHYLHHRTQMIQQLVRTIALNIYVQTFSVNQSRVTNARARAYLPQPGLLHYLHHRTQTIQQPVRTIALNIDFAQSNLQNANLLLPGHLKNRFSSSEISL